MRFTCLLLSSLFAVVYSASIYQISGDIPVKVIYSDEEFKTLLQEPLNDQATIVEVEQVNNINSNDNLNAKIQLSVSEASQVDKHLPININTKSEPLPEKENVPEVEVPKPTSEVEVPKPSEDEKPVEPPAVSEAAPVNPEKEEIPASPSTSAPVTPAEVLPDPNYVLLVQIVQKIVNEGLLTLQANINKYVDAETLQPAISSQQWNTLNQTITDYFSLLLQQSSGKADINIISLASVGVRDITSAFLLNLKFNSESNLRQEPIGSGIVNYIANGFNQITNRIDNVSSRSTTSNTVLNEGEVTTAKPASGPLQGFQNAANQIGQTISNINPFNQKPPANNENKPNDETTPPNPLQGFQNAANQFSSAIQGLNPFNQKPPAAANGQEDEQKPPTPLQGFQNAANQLGQAILNLNPFTQAPPPAAGNQADETTVPTPLQGFQNAANQFGQSILNLNPFNAQASNSDNNGTALLGFQNAATQFGQAISGLNPFNQQSQTNNNNNNENPPPPNNPLQGFQNAANQVVQAIGSLNVFNQVSTAKPPAGSQGDETVPSNPNPLQPFQNAANQIGSAINSLNPFNQPPPPQANDNAQGDDVTTKKPLQPLQSAFQNFANAVNSLNPFNQAGSTTQKAPPAVESPVSQAAETSPASQPVGTTPSTTLGQNLVNSTTLVPGGSNLQTGTLGIGAIIDTIGQLVGGEGNDGSNNNNNNNNGTEENNANCNKSKCHEFLESVIRQLPSMINPKRKII